MSQPDANPLSLLLHQPEGKTLEFKRDLSSPRPLLKTLVAFANSAGGKLVIGMTDDKQLIGVENPLDEEERLCSLIADSITPRLVPEIELVTLEQVTLLVVEVYPSNARPHWLTGEGAQQGVYVRLGSTNRRADPELIGELVRSVVGGAFDEIAMPALSVDAIDRVALRQAFGDKRLLDEQALLTLKLITPDQGRLVPTRGGILLFGKERLRHFSDAWVQCGRFFGSEKIDIFDHADINAPLPQAVDEVMLFLKKHAYRSADLSEVRRKDVWSIPLAMLREGIINALVHSDYSQRGAPIRVVFLDDRIEIESPGILLPGLTIEEIKRGTSRIRNHVIARVFRELNLIEQWGTGVRRIFAEANAQGLPEPRIEEVGMRLRLTIYLASEHRITPKRGSQPQGLESRLESGLESLTERILGYLQTTPLAKSELAKALGHNSISSTLNLRVNELLEQQYIERTIPDKPNSRLQKYRLTEKGEKMLTAKNTKETKEKNHE